MCAEAKDAGMKTLIALDDQEVKSKLSSYLLQGMSNHSYSLKYQRLGEGGRLGGTKSQLFSKIQNGKLLLGWRGSYTFP